MELKQNYYLQNKLQVCTYEMVGTIFMAIMLNWSAQTNDRIASFTGTFFILMILFGPVSGAHFNPAITIGVVVQGNRPNLKTNLTYFFYIFCA